MIHMKCVLVRTTDIKTKANLLCCWRQRIGSSGFWGQCLRVYQSCGVSPVVINLSLECKINTNLRST